jgi:hypothetical protein
VGFADAPLSGGSGFDANVWASGSTFDSPRHCCGSGFDAHPTSQCDGLGFNAPLSGGSDFDANVCAGGPTFDPLGMVDPALMPILPLNVMVWASVVLALMPMWVLVVPPLIPLDIVYLALMPIYLLM